MALLGLWRGPFRLSGVALIAAGLATPLITRPPDLLIAADAHLVGIRTPDGMFLEKTSSTSAFTRHAWTQYWASGPPIFMPVEGNAAGGEINCQITFCFFRIAPAAAPLLLLRQYARRTGCGAAMLVIALSGWPLHCAPATRIISRRSLHRDGATAIWLTPSGPEFLTDRDVRGDRPWIPPNDSAPLLSPLLSSTPATSSARQSSNQDRVY
jgi:competence protein ComEC